MVCSNLADWIFLRTPSWPTRLPSFSVRMRIPPEAEFLVILCTCINLRPCHLRLTLGPRPSICSHIIGQREELRSGHPVQKLNNISHGKNRSSTSGKPEFVEQQFFDIPASVLCVNRVEEIPGGGGRPRLRSSLNI
jgi:hypothetical protein